jgi:hypothetical protein
MPGCVSLQLVQQGGGGLGPFGPEPGDRVKRCPAPEVLPDPPSGLRGQPPQRRFRVLGEERREHEPPLPEPPPQPQRPRRPCQVRPHEDDPTAYRGEQALEKFLRVGGSGIRERRRLSEVEWQKILCPHHSGLPHEGLSE